jgi:hypothetical protein
MSYPLFVSWCADLGQAAYLVKNPAGVGCSINSDCEHTNVLSTAYALSKHAYIAAGPCF